MLPSRATSWKTWRCLMLRLVLAGHYSNLLWPGAIFNWRPSRGKLNNVWPPIRGV